VSRRCVEIDRQRTYYLPGTEYDAVRTAKGNSEKRKRRQTVDLVFQEVALSSEGYGEGCDYLAGVDDRFIWQLAFSVSGASTS
jgi:hypothetical protein